MEHVAAVGRHAGAALRAMASRQPAVKDVRGAGLIWGIELDRPAAAVVEAALERGLLINRTSDTVIRLLPPYVITTERDRRRHRAARRGDRRCGAKGAQA